MALRGSTNVIVTLIGPYHPFSLFCHKPFAYFPFPLPVPCTVDISPQFLAFDDICRAKGESIIHQRLCPCLDDPKPFKLEYLRARARCFYPFYIIPELTPLLSPIENRGADATNSSRQFHLALFRKSPIRE